MDELDEETLNALRDGKPHTFNQLLEKVTFNHNTLTLHLDKLVDLKLILKEKIKRETRGRPIYVYSVSSVGRKASLMLRSGVEDVVALPFSSRARDYTRQTKNSMNHREISMILSSSRRLNS